MNGTSINPPDHVGSNPPFVCDTPRIETRVECIGSSQPIDDLGPYEGI